MKIIEHPSARDFLSAAEAFLSDNEAINNFPLGLARRMEATPTPGARFLTVHHPEGAIAGAAVQTPPWRLTLSECSAATGSALADFLVGQESITGVSGPAGPADAMASRWAKRAHVALCQKLTVYVLTQLIPPPPTPGALRVASAEDRPLLRPWLAAFSAEAIPHDPPPNPESPTVAQLEMGNTWVWEVDGEAVCFLASGRSTGRGRTIGPVYTPPEHRGRGYAAAATAAASQVIFDRGFAFCCLLADQANPISNRVYQRIRYQGVADHHVYDFVVGG